MSDHDQTATFEESWNQHGDPALRQRRFDCPSCGPRASARCYRCTSCGTDLATSSGRTETTISDDGDGATGEIVDVDVDEEGGDETAGLDVADDECIVECPFCPAAHVITKTRWLDGGTFDCTDCDDQFTIAEATVRD